MTKKRKMGIIILAYFNRYLFLPLLAFASILAGKDDRMRILFLSISFFLFAVYNVVGYWCRWKHIYCAFQSACRQKMTPENIQWDKMRMGDIYGVPAVLAVLAVFLFSCYCLGVV